MISTKKESLSTLVHKLDRLVSEVVRRTAADSEGYVKCISCGTRIHHSKSQCAHFINRGNMATRFNLLNLAPACYECNILREDFHLKAWEELLGPERTDYLRQEGRSMRKLMRFELEKGIELMEAKLKSLR
jgi:hypothetical protein